MYANYFFYSENYGDADEKAFNRLSYDAGRFIDAMTTGADGFRKLKEAFPGNAYDAEAVIRCECVLIDLLYAIDKYQRDMMDGTGYAVDAETGAKIGKVVTSKSAGSESVSFSAGASGSSTAVVKAAQDEAVKHQVMASKVREMLSGIADRNGVNLLYMGVYPR